MDPATAYFLGKIGLVTALSAAETAALIAGWPGAVRRHPQARVAAAIVSPIAIILQFVSGVYFVFGDLPAVLQWLGSLFPCGG